MREPALCYHLVKEEGKGPHFTGNKESWNEFTERCKMGLFRGSSKLPSTVTLHLHGQKLFVLLLVHCNLQSCKIVCSGGKNKLFFYLSKFSAGASVTKDIDKSFLTINSLWQEKLRKKMKAWRNGYTWGF